MIYCSWQFEFLAINSPLAVDFNVKTIHLYLKLKDKVSMGSFVFRSICFVLSSPVGRNAKDFQSECLMVTPCFHLLSLNEIKLVFVKIIKEDLKFLRSGFLTIKIFYCTLCWCVVFSILCKSICLMMSSP